MSDAFREAFPAYLAMGMSYAEYWEQESWLVKSYREAHRIREDEINYSAWLHGLYVLQAMNSGVPVVLTGILKQKADLPSFPSRPIDFTEMDKKEKEEKQMQLQIAKMQEMAEQFNKTFGRKQKKQ